MAEQRIGKGATRVTGFVSKASFTPGENAEMKREAKRREAVTLIVAFISPLSFPQRLELDSFVDLITPPSPKDLLTLPLLSSKIRDIDRSRIVIARSLFSRTPSTTSRRITISKTHPLIGRGRLIRMNKFLALRA